LIVTIGDGCLNIIFEIKRALQRGANHDISRVVRRPGGNAMVTALALSGWGLKSAYLGVLGNDAEGEMLLSWMRTIGTEVSGVINRPAPTVLSYVILDENDRTILDQRNVSATISELQPADWQASPAMIKAVVTAEAVMLDRYCSAIHAPVIGIFRSRRQHGEKPLLAYRTGSRPSSDLTVEEGILHDADIALTKGVFLKNIGLGTEWVEGCRQLSEQYGTPLVVATIGSEGAAYYDSMSNTGGIVPAVCFDKPLTTLGGGDFFRAGFLMAYTEGKPLVESIRCGHASAAVHFSRKESSDIENLFFPRSEVETMIHQPYW
jgi:sugar/nucleoside kinase (ribokinase family)